jgi:3-methylcrotonyl-CoA carboxylase alpha subunit
MVLRHGGDRWSVEVARERGGLRAIVEGRRIDLTVTEVAAGSFVAWHEGRAQAFHCVRDGDLIHLCWRGVAYRLEVEAGRNAARAPRAAAGGLEAPMPGKVIALRVAEGQAVRKGEELLVIEAMKMENALRAPRDGVVGAVAARVGDMVSPGRVLVELR